jgi:hypothetical protein
MFLAGYRFFSFATPAIPSASMNKPPKSGVASMRPVREADMATAVKLSAAALNASHTTSV